MDDQTFLGLRTAIYTVPDLERAKAWYSALFGAKPYFDEPFYVGFNVGGFELGLNPDTSKAPPGPGGTVAYWGVKDAEAAFRHALQNGAGVHEGLQEVGEGIKVATVTDPFGNLLGIIENPHFKLEGPGPVPAEG
ncbi:MAG TPA: VOC family protein [Thermoanaerobaculia bacterium]|nr:VOC family protein [Thermoanaerobaculia bacterium]